jgi:excisionase family DNA binding protein
LKQTVVSIISDGASEPVEAEMGLAQVRFEAVDERTREQAQEVAQTIESAAGKGVTLHLEGRLAQIFANIAAVVGRVGGLAYGGLSSELTPEQAGKILGVSRPLVVRRMDDGRLPFRYEGAHRRCKLEDVLKLKAEEDRQSAALSELAGMDDVDYRRSPRP